MTAVISNSRGIVHSIGGIEDHIHALIEMPKDITLSDMIRDIKTTATHWLKNNNPRNGDYKCSAEAIF